MLKTYWRAAWRTNTLEKVDLLDIDKGRNWCRTSAGSSSFQTTDVKHFAIWANAHSWLLKKHETKIKLHRELLRDAEKQLKTTKQWKEPTGEKAP